MDILTLAAIRMPCPQCGQSYSVPLSDVLLSHKIMHEGCPVTQERECPPVFQSRLAAESAIDNLRRAWRRLEKRAQKDGGELVLLGPNPGAAAALTNNERALTPSPEGVREPEDRSPAA